MSLTLTAPPAAPAEPRLLPALPASDPRAERHSQPARTGPDIVDVWGCDSFPASDPPANW